MAIRRSARLRTSQQPVEDIPSETSTNQNKDKKTKKSRKNLDTVVEREELPSFPTPPKHQPTSAPPKAQSPKTQTPKPQTPKAQTPKHTPKHTPKAMLQRISPAKTPTTSIARPNLNEMHPSKVHQSTTKQPDSGLILGFNPIKKDAQGNVVKDTPAHNTPSKNNASPASAYYGTPAFDFKFPCQDSELSDEAKKLMESVRKDVARMKTQMIHEKVTEPESHNAERRIAKPKGKSTRFSDAHMAEFRKMDSIAGHASAFRAAPGRFQPVKMPLKRTNSKARLDEAESKPSPARVSEDSGLSTPTAKRVKHEKPASSANRSITKPAVPRPRAGVRSSLFTPTRASLARASLPRASASLKPARTTMIPSIAKSPLSKPADVPSTPRTEFNPRFKSSIPTLSSLKSIIRRHQPLFSKDPTKIASGTHRTSPDFTPELLLQPSHESSHEPTQTPSPRKKVDFTPCTKPRATEELASPTPSKLPTLRTFPSMTDIVYPTLPALTPERGSAQTPTIRPVRPSEDPVETTISGVPHGLGPKRFRATDAPVEATLPEVPGMPHGLSHKKRHRATEDETEIENVPPVGDSAERSTKRVKISTPARSKIFASSPLKPRSHTPQSGPRAGRTGTPASARPRARMSRLNLLAQPKSRS
ncbi:hypothetical protein BJX99DRAFT_224280 [Aspergillus californicus]